jgi:nicotinic acid mononucleotide adenylyltransferase
MSRRKVCLFGTSANPPTGEGGHLGIATALTKMGVFDEIRILPVFRHMFAEKRNPEQPSFQDRIEMCRLGFKDLPKVTVSDQEEKCFQWAAKQKNM